MAGNSRDSTMPAEPEIRVKDFTEFTEYEQELLFPESSGAERDLLLLPWGRSEKASGMTVSVLYYNNRRIYFPVSVSRKSSPDPRLEEFIVKLSGGHRVLHVTVSIRKFGRDEVRISASKGVRQQHLVTTRVKQEEGMWILCLLARKAFGCITSRGKSGSECIRVVIGKFIEGQGEVANKFDLDGNQVEGTMVYTVETDLLEPEEMEVPDGR